MKKAIGLAIVVLLAAVAATAGRAHDRFVGRGRPL